jgi:hypothetical protein
LGKSSTLCSPFGGVIIHIFWEQKTKILLNIAHNSNIVISETSLTGKLGARLTKGFPLLAQRYSNSTALTPKPGRLYPSASTAKKSKTTVKAEVS